MTATELLTAAELEFGGARISTYLVGFDPQSASLRTVLEVCNPAVDTKWRQAALVARRPDGRLDLLPPVNPADPSDWRRAERLT